MAPFPTLEHRNELTPPSVGPRGSLRPGHQPEGRGPAGLTAQPVPTTETEADDQLFSERAYWLFATGHRHGGMRRLVRQYGRLADAVIPVGTYFKGGDHGTNVNLPIPFQAENNPRFDRSLCDPDTL